MFWWVGQETHEVRCQVTNLVMVKEGHKMFFIKDWTFLSGSNYKGYKMTKFYQAHIYVSPVPYRQLNFTSPLQQNGIFETLLTFRHFETLSRKFSHDPHTKIDFHSLSMLLNGIALRNQSFRNLTALSDSQGVQDFFLQIYSQRGFTSDRV